MAMPQVSKRLSRIFESILGCSIELQMMDQIIAQEWNASDLTDLRANPSLSPKYIQNIEKTVFAFPIRQQNELLGLALVIGFKDASPQRLMMLAELMMMVLDYSIRQGNRGERLRMIEERMALLDENSNVIPLRPARYDRVLRATEPDMNSEENENLASPLITNPLLLISKPGFPVNRIAIEIHGLSKRWALVGSEDLPTEIFSTRESIEQLGGLTLFIRDISTLTTAQQTVLGEYLGRAASEDTPHIIAGATESVEDLVHNGKLLPYLSRLFTVSTLQSNGKSAAEITKELVNASLQQILEQTREEAVGEHQVGENFIPFHSQYFNPDDTSTVH